MTTFIKTVKKTPMFITPAEGFSTEQAHYDLGAYDERQRIIEVLDLQMHTERNLGHHIEKRSTICVTCRAISIMNENQL